MSFCQCSLYLYKDIYKLKIFQINSISFHRVSSTVYLQQIPTSLQTFSCSTDHQKKKEKERKRDSENFREYRNHGKQAIVANEGYSTGITSPYQRAIGFRTFSMAFPTNSTSSFFFPPSPSVAASQTRLCNAGKLDEERTTSNDLARGHSKSMKLD